MSDKFYMVIHETGVSKDNRHPTKDEAVSEAGRLAQQSNERYFIFQTIGVVAPVVHPVAFTEI